MSRPVLNDTLPSGEFRRHYWLKSELQDFCRAHNLSAAGSKLEISDRIAHFLATGERQTPTSTRPRGDAMPTELTRATLITPGFRCSQALRAFSEREIGSHFHFDGVMRNFIRQGAGQTLQAAIEVWQQAQQSPRPAEIAPQFEYNRHTREFFAANPGASREQAIAAWWAKRGRPEDGG